MKFLKYLSEILFPSTCVTCGTSINDDKNLFCAKCLTNTVFTSFHSAFQNEMMDRLISIPTLKGAFAPLYFKKDAPIRELFYKIKYGNRPDIAQKMAAYLAQKWMDIDKDKLPVDAICYVPVHKIKMSKRGYNQSEIIAKEVSEIISTPLIHMLERKSNIETQTHFGRMDRLKNQEGSIGLKTDISGYQHVLMIDDILTTGATIETCYDAIREGNKACGVSVLTLAITDSW